MTRQSVVLNDMSKCIPGSHLSHEPRFDRWSLISYETPEISGVAIYLGNIFSRAYEGLPDISLPLNVAGWFAIHPKGSSGDYIEVKEEAITGDPPRGEYEWWSVPPTRSFLIDKLDGEVVGRYWRDTGL